MLVWPGGGTVDGGVGGLCKRNVQRRNGPEQTMYAGGVKIANLDSDLLAV